MLRVTIRAYDIGTDGWMYREKGFVDDVELYAFLEKFKIREQDIYKREEGVDLDIHPDVSYGKPFERK